MKIPKSRKFLSISTNLLVVLMVVSAIGVFNVGVFAYYPDSHLALTGWVDVKKPAFQLF